MQTVTVVHLVGGHVTEAVHTGHRVTVHRRSRTATVKVHDETGAVTELVSYGRAEIVTRRPVRPLSATESDQNGSAYPTHTLKTAEMPTGGHT